MLQMSTPDSPRAAEFRARIEQLRAEGHPMQSPEDAAASRAALAAWSASRRDCCNSPIDGGHAWGCDT